MSFDVIIVQLAVLLFFAKVLGEITRRLGVSSLVGEITAGIVAGPLLGIVSPNDTLGFFAFLGLLILVFMIGLQTKFDEIKKNMYTGIGLAIAGAALTFVAGFLLGELLFGSFNVGIAIGVAMISTSTAIPIKILIDRGEYHTRIGRVFVIMAIADDIIAILALSLLVSYLSAGSIVFLDVVTLFFAILGFIFVLVTAGDRAINRALEFIHRSKDEEILFTIPLVIAFVVGVWSQNVGLAVIMGVFIAGMAMSRSYVRSSIIEPKIKTFGYSLFVPIFFAYSSIFINLGALASLWWVIALMLVVGIATKAIGSGFLARYAGFDSRSQAIFAIGMVPRGEYGIVISQAALAAGVLSQDIYTALISFIVLTVILTPVLFAAEAKLAKGYGR